MTISRVSLQNFKCFEALRFELGSLTLLTGYNAAGKSTAMHGLLLMAQAAKYTPSQETVGLVGPLINLGMPVDVVSGAERSLSIGVEGDSSRISWSLAPIDRHLNQLSIVDASLALPDGSTKSWSGELVPSGTSDTEVWVSLKQLAFLGVGRLTDADTFPIPSYRLPAYDVGSVGQFAPWIYSRIADDEVVEARRHPTEPGTSFRRQLDAYLGELFPGCGANSEFVPNASLVRLEFRATPTGAWRRPSNIGFGLSYAFPILVALLSAREGQTVIVDSPEAHLHPKAQSAMGRILAKFAGTGLQIIVETHSDHVLNGVRLAVMGRTIEKAAVKLLFFAGSVGRDHGVTSLMLDELGNIDRWPPGFFDQAESDLAKLSGWA